MEILLGLLLVVLAAVVLEIMLYVAGILLRKLSSKSFLSSTGLPPSRKLLVAAIATVVLAGIEFLRYQLAALLLQGMVDASGHSGVILWLAALTVFSVPVLPALALLSTLFAAVREGAIAACDGCNEWIPPFGGVIGGDSWGSENLNCLRCAITKRPKAILLYPLSKPYTSIFWLTQGMWR